MENTDSKDTNQSTAILTKAKEELSEEEIVVKVANLINESCKIIIIVYLLTFYKSR